MSEHQNKKPELSRRELIARKEAIFSEYLGHQWFGDIYRQMHTLYPCPEIENVSMVMDPKIGWFAGGEGKDDDGNIIPMIVIGTNPELDSRTIKDRLVTRFGMPRELLDSDAGIIVCRLVAFAHELGHVVQMNPAMRDRFGGLREGYRLPVGQPYTDEQYQRYLASDKEGNADYIAASVLAHTTFGEMLGMQLPEQELNEWRTWAAEHPVKLSPQTVDI